MSSVNKKLNIKIVIIIVLSILLLFNSTVLAFSTLPIENNIFKTGIIDIRLGGVKDNLEEYIYDNEHKLISDNEYLFEPGITVEKKFFIENCAGDKGWDVYYKIYFDNVKGKLADELIISLKDLDGNIYFEGKPIEFVEDNVLSFDRPLSAQGINKHYYIISFYYPKECGNVKQGEILEFDFCAKAVQTKNNTNREF